MLGVLDCIQSGFFGIQIKIYLYERCLCNLHSMPITKNWPTIKRFSCPSPNKKSTTRPFNGRFSPIHISWLKLLQFSNRIGVRLMNSKQYSKKPISPTSVAFGLLMSPWNSVAAVEFKLETIFYELLLNSTCVCICFGCRSLAHTRSICTDKIILL